MTRRPLLPDVRRLFRLPPSPRHIASDIDAELRFHLESRVADLIARGSTPEDARRQAESEYGDLVASRSELAAVDRRIRARERRAAMFDVVRQDVTYALRGLRRQPGFAATIVVTLALAVGANAAVFSLIDPLLFRPPPGVGDPGSLRRLYTNLPNSPRAVNGRAAGTYYSYPEFLAIRAALGGTARVAAYRAWDSTSIRRAGTADTLVGSIAYVTADFLPMLGVRVSPGRVFTEAEDDVAAPAPVAVVSRRFARRVFGDGAPLGQSIIVRNLAHTVIGVAADDFEGIDWTSVDIWVPFSTHARPEPSNRGPWHTRGDVYIPLVARVNPGVDDRALEARATAAYRRAYTRNLKSELGREVLAGPILSTQGPMKATQEVSISTRLAVVSLVVLLIACANVANLLIARAVRRRREIAVRLALGVSRARLASQLITESVILALIAAGVAMLVAGWAGAALRVALLPRVRWIGEPVGIRVLVFTVFCAAGAALLAGVVPAIVASRPALTDALKSGARDGATHGSRLRGALLAVQSALSVLLLAGAALFAGSLRNVRDVDLGFETRDLVVAYLYFEDRRPHPERAALATVAERLTSMPGVVGASYGAGAPLATWYSGFAAYVPGRDSSVAGNETPFISVSAAYFDVAGTPLLAGRGFLPSDRPDGQRVMIVSASMAAAIWPGETAVGKCLALQAATAPCYTIVGVAKDAHQWRIVENPQNHFYLPLGQAPNSSLPNEVLVRAKPGAAGTVAAMVGRELRRTFPTAHVNARTVERILAPQLGPWRLGAHLFTALSLLALAVAAIGVYSAVAFTVRQRTHEIGVRIALGARTTDLLRMVVGRGVGVVALGVGLGIAGALVAGRFISALLYAVSPRDPSAIAVAAIVMLLVALIASSGPAWAASRVDPVKVLREE